MRNLPHVDFDSIKNHENSVKALIREKIEKQLNKAMKIIDLIDEEAELLESAGKFKQGLMAAALGWGSLYGANVGHNSITKDQPIAQQQINQANQKLTDVDYLAQTIWGEARGYDDKHKKAIGHVILNRVNHEKFGDSIKEVVTKNKQFSCWNKSDPNYKLAKKMRKLDKLIKAKKAPNGKDFDSWFKEFKNSGVYLEYKAWVDSFNIARKILRGQTSDTTKGALYYHTAEVKPIWRTKLQQIGRLDNHIFYRYPKNNQKRP
jgi:spore germination cell wall hydrolase CwlJ-like protein